MTITKINSVLRLIQLIPLLLVFFPILNSYWEKRNSINGLRKTRMVLLILIASLIVSNLYFFIFSTFEISRANPHAQFIIIIEKIINIISYWLLYFLFSHARKHE